MKKKKLLAIGLALVLLLATFAAPAMAALSFSDVTDLSAVADGPTDCVVYGGDIYVTDYDNNRIIKYNIADKSKTPCLGGSFNHPTGITVDETGIFYVADKNSIIGSSDRVVSFKISGANITDWKTFSGFNEPMGIFYKDGKLYVADTNNDQIVICNTDINGNVTPNSVIQTNSSNGLSRPYDVAVDSANNLWICNFDGKNVLKLKQDGTYISSYSFGTRPYGIALNSNDDAYVSEREITKQEKDKITGKMVDVTIQDAIVRNVQTSAKTVYGTSPVGLCAYNDQLYVVDVTDGKVSVASVPTAKAIDKASVDTAIDGKNLAITDSTPASVTINGNIKGATLDMSSQLNPPVGTNMTTNPLPAIHVNGTVNSTTIDMQIPAGTKVTADSSWDGTFKLPTITNSTAASDTFEIGFGSTKLTFDQPVRLFFQGKAGKKAYYYHSSSAARTEITATLTSDSAAGIPAGQDIAKMDSGSDMIVWTMHCTYYVLGDDSGGGGGGGGGGTLTQDTAQAAPRIAGADRFETANNLADQGWPNGADTVVLTYGYDFPDALAAAPLAKKNNAPILLTDKNTLTASTLAEIQKLKAKKIILVGGTGVISQSIQDALAATYGQANVTRYAGNNRYETAAAIAAALGSSGKAIVVNGDKYADALAVSSYAADQGIPILFTQAAALPSQTSKALTDQKVTNTIVVGGEGAVSAAVYSQLSGAARYAGNDRYATSVAVATGLKMKLDQVYIVTGLDFPDALVAGNLAAYTQSPLIMVDKGLPDSTNNFLKANKASITKATIIGGQSAVSTAQAVNIQSALK